jgi:molybdate transport system ATP-binding protein
MQDLLKAVRNIEHRDIHLLRQLLQVDLPRKRELMPYLQKLAKQVDIPMLYVSHSLEEMLTDRQPRPHRAAAPDPLQRTKRFDFTAIQHQHVIRQMLYVSHSLEEILHLADNVLVLDSGKVKAFGPLERGDSAVIG